MTNTNLATYEIKPSQNELNQLKITSYLTCNPLDEHSDLELEWFEDTPGFKTVFADDPDYEEHPFYHPENIAWYNRIEEHFKDYFLKAVVNTWPLFKKIPYNSLQIPIDNLGLLIPDDMSIASYLYKDKYSNRIKKGCYIFFVHRNFFFRNLAFLYKNQPLSDHSLTVFEHEIIHFYDDIIARCGKYRDSYSLINQCILRFRSEGIADLFYTYTGGNAIPSMTDALAAFKETMDRLNQIIKGISKTEKKEDVLKKHLDGYFYYELGPWLMLKVLSLIGNENQQKMVLKHIRAIEDKANVTHAEKLYVIESCLHLDKKEVLKTLKKLAQ